MKTISVDYSKRIERLQNLLKKNNLDVFYVEDVVSLFYLTGLSISKGILCIDLEKSVLFVSGIYQEYAKSHTSIKVENYSEKDVFSFLSNYHLIGLEGQEISLDQGQKIQNSLQKQRVRSIALVKELRKTKDEDEIALLKKSADLLWQGFEYLLSIIKEGITEKELSISFHKYCLDHGAEKLSFDPIIAFGANSSMPHHRSTESRLKDDSIILIDIGVVLNRYASDMTRTIFFGKPDPKLQQIYSVVERAKNAALQCCRAGERVGKLEEEARKVFQAEGLESFYAHSLGHGIGLDVHEPPIIRSKGPFANDILQKNMVITIEPGLYLPKKGGVRIEEMIQITNRGYEAFFPNNSIPKLLME